MRVQHGDVVLVKIDNVTEGSKQIEVSDGFIVERGEGVHTHVLTKVEGVEAYTTVDGFLEMLFKKPTVLDHEEHGKLVIKPGIYRKVIENEYDAEKDEAYKTRD